MWRERGWRAVTWDLSVGTGSLRLPTQDGRRLRRCRRRRNIEGSIRRSQNLSRHLTHDAYHVKLLHGFVKLACLMSVTKKFRN